MKPMRPEDVFRAEKERALTFRNSQHARLLAEAKAAFDKLMAEGQAARKSGRPRKHPLPPLKTSSAPPRPPAQPVAPTPIVKLAEPAAPAPVAKAAKPAPKRSASAKRERNAVSKKAKAKPKTKRSTKR